MKPNLKFQTSNYKCAGFSILEMVVAIGIFTIVITIAVTFFNQSLVFQRRVLSSQDIQDNMRYVVESMAREIRMGSDFSVGETIVPVRGFSQFLASNVLSFTNFKGESVIYSWDQNQVSNTYHLILRNGQPIISSNIEVYDFGFVLMQDPTQPQTRITVIARAKMRQAIKPEEQVPIVVQTTISPRGL